ncbi:hypothetical protein JW998_14595 [candidate division KSB1 bacterium]|nr:hypothetical protein [candidate division KSB1 bacterium]
MHYRCPGYGYQVADLDQLYQYIIVNSITKTYIAHCPTENFKAFYEAGLFVGQLRTRLGISGWEMNGPRAAAMALLDFIREK